MAVLAIAAAVEIVMVRPEASAAMGRAVVAASCPVSAAMVPAIAWAGHVVRAVAPSCRVSAAAREIVAASCSSPVPAVCKGRPRCSRSFQGHRLRPVVDVAARRRTVAAASGPSNPWRDACRPTACHVLRGCPCMRGRPSSTTRRNGGKWHRGSGSSSSALTRPTARRVQQAAVRTAYDAGRRKCTRNHAATVPCCFVLAGIQKNKRTKTTGGGWLPSGPRVLIYVFPSLLAVVVVVSRHRRRRRHRLQCTAGGSWRVD